VLACALARALGRPLDEYAAEVLFAPLGIDEWSWPRDPEGYAWGFGHLQLRTRDLAKIGEAWRTGALVDASYRADAMRAWTNGGPPEHRPYGYLWWLGGDGCFGAGYLGQLLWVTPRAVVASNTGEAFV
jgi:CubicO group peptidase (beta-lactamase class C family)